MPLLRPVSDEPIAIRQALEEGWQGFRRHAWVLIALTLILGGLNLLCWLLYRHSGGLLDRGLPQSSPLQLGEATVALVAYLLSGFWLLVGLIHGAERALDHQPPRLGMLLRCDGRAVARLAWSVLVLLLLLALVRQSGELSSWLLTLLLPRLGELPLWAAWAVVIYVLADQVLLLPITVLGNQAGLAAFRSGRLATDRHWLHALGLLLVVSLVLLAGFLLLVGLAVALPWALCTLTAAYRQLFVLKLASGQPQDQR
jgi:hypothetical protein